MPDNSSSHGEAKYSGSNTAGIPKSFCAIFIALLQLSIPLFLSRNKGFVRLTCGYYNNTNKRTSGKKATVNMIGNIYIITLPRFLQCGNKPGLQ